jgi:hypothetical protein
MYVKHNTMPQKTTEYCTYCFVQVNDATPLRHFCVELLKIAQRRNLTIFLTPVLKMHKVGRFPNFGQTVFMQRITFLSSIINQNRIRATSLHTQMKICMLSSVFSSKIQTWSKPDNYFLSPHSHGPSTYKLSGIHVITGSFHHPSQSYIV